MKTKGIKQHVFKESSAIEDRCDSCGRMRASIHHKQPSLNAMLKASLRAAKKKEAKTPPPPNFMVVVDDPSMERWVQVIHAISHLDAAEKGKKEFEEYQGTSQMTDGTVYTCKLTDCMIFNIATKLEVKKNG